MNWLHHQAMQDLTQAELKHLHKFYIKLAKNAETEANLKQTHSVEDEYIEKISAQKKKKKLIKNIKE